jgi:uncharacterized membrane protein YdjX (TVP38/TMEM64 family)
MPGGNGKRLTERGSRGLAAVVAVGVLAGLAFLGRSVPAGRVVGLTRDWVAGLGVWGALGFGVAYAVAVVGMAPAWILTVAAGAIFGPWLGTAMVSIASTTGAGLAFLVARYLGRGAVERRVGRDPRFAAMDRAIAEDGWKVVALLRLSPAVPFNVQNYLYGLTGIGFWPYLLTSWVAMLPGTLLYVWLGHVGRAGLEATGGDRSRTPAEWAALGVGLVATLAVSVYLARIARRALRRNL